MVMASALVASALVASAASQANAKHGSLRNISDLVPCALEPIL
jgi:hypothetical protein